MSPSKPPMRITLSKPPFPASPEPLTKAARGSPQSACPRSPPTEPIFNNCSRILSVTPSSTGIHNGLPSYISPPRARVNSGCSPSPITASALPPTTRRLSLPCSNACIPMMNTQEPVSDWPSASESSIGIRGASGSNPRPDADQFSALRSQSDESQTAAPWHILVVEDNSADIFLIREAINAAELPAILHFVKDGELAIRFLD